MSIKVKQTVSVQQASYLKPAEETKEKDIIFKGFKKKNDNDLKQQKFDALKTIYTNKSDYKEALKKALAEGTYNPDYPEFIFANNKTVKNLKKLEIFTGKNSIVKENGTIDVNTYKKAMKDYISQDLNIDINERKFAQENGLSKSDLKTLAKPLGIEILNKRENKKIKNNDLSEMKKNDNSKIPPNASKFTDFLIRFHAADEE